MERVRVRYGFAGGGRVCFSPAAESSDGVVARGWGGGFAFVATAISCDEVDKHVFMVKNKSKILICRFWGRTLSIKCRKIRQLGRQAKNP